MPLGANILKLSKQKNMSLYKIAKESEVSESYINDIVHERKNNPGIIILNKIARVLGVTVDELIN